MTETYLAAALDAAKHAGAVLAKGSGLRHINFQDDRDVKLKADTDSEALIREHLHEKTGLPIVGEEGLGDPNLPYENVLYWVVDPLDGTFNYLRNFGLCCVSIGLMRGLEPVCGVVYDFNNQTCFAANCEDASGLLVNGQQHETRWPETLAEASLCCGFPSARDYSDTALLAFVNRVQQFKKIRMIGSAALAIAYVAVGRTDAYVEETVRLWDVAGGLALAKAAGAHYRLALQPDGPPFACDLAIAGNPQWLKHLEVS